MGHIRIMTEELQLRFMRALLSRPEMSQRELSRELYQSLRKVNHCLKALKEKGLIKWEKFSDDPTKSQYLYLHAPDGMSEKLKLTTQFLNMKKRDNELVEKGGRGAWAEGTLGPDDPSKKTD